MKKTLSVEEIESQMALELPARELMTMNDFNNIAASSASNRCSAGAGNDSLVAALNIAAAVCIQEAVASSTATQTIS
ncbi:MAG: hypothetical protein JOZ71_13355 [Ktedonobacteraceae bacterium]|nr:hypothetical protein [Ktedonobacteraceae bacterium]